MAEASIQELLAEYYEERCTCTELDSGGDCPYCKMYYLSSDGVLGLVQGQEEIIWCQKRLLESICGEAAAFSEIDDLGQATDSLCRIMKMASPDAKRTSR